VSLTDALAVFFLTAFASTAQSVTGFGFGLLIIPLLILLLGPHDAVVLSSVLGTALSALMLVKLRHAVDWRLVLSLLLAAALGMPFGLALLLWLDTEVLQVAIATSVIVVTLLLARGLHFHRTTHTGNLVAGFLAGLFRTSAGMPGPPVVIYLQAGGLSPEALRAVLAAFFVASGLVAIAMFAAEGSFGGEMALLSLAGLPAMSVGWRFGALLFHRIPADRFRWLIYAILIGSSLVAIVTAFT
jgi:hypothetical protein